MKRLTIWIGFLFQFFIISNIYGQKIGKVIKRVAKQKAEQKISQATGEAIDKGVESVFSEKDKNSGKDTEAGKDIEVPKQPANDNINMPKTDTTGFGVYTKFTFEPGNKIIFYDDFQKDALGDFPVNWETNASGEVVTNSKYEGKWLSLSGRSGYFPSTVELPENYTVEFDLATNGFGNNNSASFLTIAFINKKSYTMGGAGGHAQLQISLHKSAGLSIGNTGAERSPRIGTKLYRKFNLDTLVHISMTVNKNRLRIWMQEDKITDVPSLLVGNMGRYMLFETYGINPEKGHTVLISNFKIAESTEDLRSQLLDKGRFSTTGIYFNTDRADIRPESYAIIKSVADYLKENPEVKIQIIGHTDAQGENDYNLLLSERRAQAVIQALVQQFGIAESRLSALGKGEAEPVDDNATEKGRANNRRVEFIKI